MEYLIIEGLQGQTLQKVEAGGDWIELTSIYGDIWKFMHEQDCCESVSIEDISGELSDLVGYPLEVAEVATSDEAPEGGDTSAYYDDCQLWTFYRFRTVKGSVVIRWFGMSNGYYSVSVSITKNGKDVSYG